MNMAVDAFARLGKATPYDRIVSDALAAVLSGGETDIMETIDEDDLLKTRARKFPDAHPAAGNAGAHRTHADDQQAAAKLIATAGGRHVRQKSWFKR